MVIPPVYLFLRYFILSVYFQLLSLSSIQALHACIGFVDYHTCICIDLCAVLYFLHPINPHILLLLSFLHFIILFLIIFFLRVCSSYAPSHGLLFVSYPLHLLPTHCSFPLRYPSAFLHSLTNPALPLSSPSNRIPNSPPEL